jgi:hypothetical protein
MLASVLCRSLASNRHLNNFKLFNGMPSQGEFADCIQAPSLLLIGYVLERVLVLIDSCTVRHGRLVHCLGAPGIVSSIANGGMSFRSHTASKLIAPFRLLHPTRQARKELYIPRVKIKSFQQLSSFTFIFHVSPVLSCAVAVVPVVMILSGRELGAVGGCSILTVCALASDVPRVCMRGAGSLTIGAIRCVRDYVQDFGRMAWQ